MGKLAVAAVLLLLYCAYYAQNCEVEVLKMPLRHNNTFVRVKFVTLHQPEAPRIMYDIRACWAHCDSIDCPAFSFHYISNLCSRAKGFKNAGPHRLTLEDVEGMEDGNLGLYVQMPNMPVLEECYPSKDSFEELLKSYQNNTSPAPSTTPATSEAPGPDATSTPSTGPSTTESSYTTSSDGSTVESLNTVPIKITDSESSTIKPTTTSSRSETISTPSSSQSSSTMESIQFSKPLPSETVTTSTTSPTSSSSTTSQFKPTSTQTQTAATNATVTSTKEDNKSTDPTTVPATSKSPTSRATTTPTTTPETLPTISTSPQDGLDSSSTTSTNSDMLPSTTTTSGSTTIETTSPTHRLTSTSTFPENENVCRVAVYGENFELNDGESMDEQSLNGLKAALILGGAIDWIYPSGNNGFSLTSSSLGCRFTVRLSNGTITTWMGKRNTANDKKIRWKDVDRVSCVCSSGPTLPVKTSDFTTTVPPKPTTVSEPATTENLGTVGATELASTTDTTAELSKGTSPFELTATVSILETTAEEPEYAPAGWILVDYDLFLVPSVGTDSFTKKYKDEEIRDKWRKSGTLSVKIAVLARCAVVMQMLPTTQLKFENFVGTEVLDVDVDMNGFDGFETAWGWCV